MQSGRQPGTNELAEVLMLVILDLGDDVVGDRVVAKFHDIVKDNVLDREVDQVSRIMDGQGDDGSVILGEDGRDAKVVRLEHGKLAFQSDRVLGRRVV